MLAPGTLIADRYQLKQPLGQGGMGEVYAAHDTRLDRQVALKLLPGASADADARRRFVQEGQIAAQVVHPNIVRTYDAGDDPAGLFLVQEVLRGQPLDQALPLDVPAACAVVGGIAGALEALHTQGYVHCDVKPHNVWLRADGSPVLLDFGIARETGTATTTLIATPQYLAPERAAGAAPTPAADWYALGIMLYHLIAGHPPFDGSDIQAILAAHRDAPLPPLPIGGPAAPALDRIIARLASKDPAARPQHAADLQRDLAAAQRSAQPAAAHDAPTTVVAPLGPATPPPLPGRPTPAPNRRRWLPLLLIPLLLVAGLAFAQTRRSTAGATPTPARTPTGRAAAVTTSAAAEPTTAPLSAPAEPTAAPISAPVVAPTTAPAEPTAAPASGNSGKGKEDKGKEDKGKEDKGKDDKGKK